MDESSGAQVLLGIVVGVVGAAPMLYVLLEVTRSKTHLDAGVVVTCGVAPFIALQLVLLAVALLLPEALPCFGVATALAFLSIVCATGLWAWRRMS